MIKQIIFIINYSSLYEILEEIKENLFFKIIKYENEEDLIKDNHPSIKNSLIIIKANQKLMNKDLDKKNILNLLDSPLSFNKLIQLINIHLIKLRFNYQSKISIKGYELNLNSKFI